MSESEQTVQVGDVWERRGGERVTVAAKSATQAKDQDGYWWSLVSFGDGCLKFISRNGVPVSPAPDRTACLKPLWCDHEVGGSSEKYNAWIQDMGCTEVHSADGRRRYCSPACRDVRLPPIAKAEPVKHVERRACEAPGACGKPVNQWMAAGFGSYRGLHWRVELGGYVCSPCADTLNAPAEPAKAAKCEGRCMTMVRGGDSPAWTVCRECGDKIEAMKAKPTPAVEAKRTRVCFECDKPAPNVLMRVTREARELLCDICMTRKEEQVHDLMMFESTGAPYKGTERLPRPRLAHVGGLHDEDMLEGKGCAR